IRQGPPPSTPPAVPPGMPLGPAPGAGPNMPPIAALLPEPKTVQATGLTIGMITDLTLKTLYYTSNLAGHDIAGTLRLPFYGVVDQALLVLKKEELCEISGTAGIGEASYQYT